MNPNPSPENVRLRLSIALMDEWDPIGVKGVPGAENEYAGYVSGVLGALIAREDWTAVFDYLWQIETQYMGLAGDRRKTEIFAQRISSMMDEI